MRYWRRGVVQEFAYRPHKLKVVVMALICLGGSVLLAYFALYLDQPIDVKGWITLSAEQGRLLFGVFAALSPIGLVTMAALVFVTFADKRRVAVTPEGIVLPRPTWTGLSRDEIEIPWSQVRSVAAGEDVLRIEYDDGAVALLRVMFPSRRDFEQLVAAVESRTRGEV